MLTYLDNASSTKQAPNENLGRELLELHTVGVGAGYTEAEVRTAPDPHRAHRRRPRRADLQAHMALDGPVRVLDFSDPNASADGSAVVPPTSTTSPGTPRRRAGSRRCWPTGSSATPRPALVDRLAATYTDADTAIVPVLRALFSSPEFFASADAKQRRPLESAVATVRALGFGQARRGVAELDGLYWALESMGQQPYAWPAQRLSRRRRGVDVERGDAGPLEHHPRAGRRLVAEGLHERWPDLPRPAPAPGHARRAGCRPRPAAAAASAARRARGRDLRVPRGGTRRGPRRQRDRRLAAALRRRADPLQPRPPRPTSGESHDLRLRLPATQGLTRRALLRTAAAAGALGVVTTAVARL